ncbi:hypothetical protein [Streptomyces globisporus]|uniref:hypothetical protein n=1 Tax=Streptomyces globisporus TaxID=1908 RepID=UPI00368CB359
MAVATITIDDACDACWAKDKTARQSTMEITLMGRTWLLCDEHEAKFAAMFTELMGEGEEQ